MQGFCAAPTQALEQPVLKLYKRVAACESYHFDQALYLYHLITLFMKQDIYTELKSLTIMKYALLKILFLT